MSVAILDFPTHSPTARELLERALEPHILIGMPHLTSQGLSETWLMKELGHRHWLMLARDMGMDNADFRTASGAEAYAAICATSLRNGQLDQVAANDVLTIRSALSPVSRTQISSVHRLFVGAASIVEVELISTFVHRLAAGDNHSIARVQLPGRAATLFVDNALAKSASDLRAAIRGGSSGSSSRLLYERFRFQTSRSQEFNGAGLFYFAEFQALMDRAYEQRLSPYIPAATVSDREVFFLGNVREDEVVEVEIQPDAANPSLLHYSVRREDGKIIAWARCFRKGLC